MDHAFFKAPIAEENHRDLGLALKARGPSRAHSQGHCATNNGRGAHEADVQVDQVHGAAAPATATGSPAVELGEHGFEAAAFGQVVAVSPVVAEDLVIRLQRCANTNGDRLLTNAQVHRATHLLLGVALGNGLLNQPDAQHGAVVLHR